MHGAAAAAATPSGPGRATPNNNLQPLLPAAIAAAAPPTAATAAVGLADVGDAAAPHQQCNDDASSQDSEDEGDLPATQPQPQQIAALSLSQHPHHQHHQPRPVHLSSRLPPELNGFFLGNKRTGLKKGKRHLGVLTGLGNVRHASSERLWQKMVHAIAALGARTSPSRAEAELNHPQGARPPGWEGLVEWFGNRYSLHHAQAADVLHVLLPLVSTGDNSNTGQHTGAGGSSRNSPPPLCILGSQCISVPVPQKGSSSGGSNKLW